MPDKKIFLLDAYALIFRAYYAFIRNPRINSSGLNTSAMFGFVTTLHDVLTNQKPTHIAVVFDHKSQTFREMEFPFYKANRDETPEDIKKAEPYIRDIIKAYDIPILEAESYEADDVIGTLAQRAAGEGFEVFMMTPDKDFGQLVDDHIYMYKPGRQGNGPEILGKKEICEKFGLEDPKQYIDILGLMGDSVDNIPGVAGVGEKTAMKLIGQYGSIENLYEHIDEIKGKLKEKLENDKEKAFISKKLATILTDAPVEFDPEKLIISKPDKDKLKEIFAELEFRTLGKRLLGEDFQVTSKSTSGQLGLFGGNGQTAPVKEQSFDPSEQTYILLEDKDVPGFLKKVSKAKEIAFDTETTGLDSLTCELVGLSFAIKAGEAYYYPIPEDQKVAQEKTLQFKELLENPKSLKIGHNLKYDIKVLKRYGIDVAEPYYDTMLAHYILKPDGRHKMDLLAQDYLGYTPIPIEDLIGKRGKQQKSMRSVPLEQIKDYASEDADITYRFKEIFSKEIEKTGDADLLNKMEFPLIGVLSDMESEGVGLDVKFLEKYSADLLKEVTKVKEFVYKEAGVEFNLDSPKQLGEVLFDHLKIEYKGKKTKTGQYSTNEETLSGLKEDHPIIGKILQYREITKLRSTYVDALPKLVNPNTGRVHTTFNQAIASTGRLSSLHPNLQNIPIRTERGRKIRKAFIPRSKEYTLLAADYSQIELRIIADISKDEQMLNSFQQGEDIHTATASKVFGVEMSDVTREMRRRAKAVNFGIAYGQGAFGLSQNLKISRGEAKEIIENYFEKFPGVRSYMTETVQFARDNGYVETLLKRKRYLRNINSKNFTVRAQDERLAINSPIQGSAADMIKMAMINIYREMEKRELQSKMILQVHDELVFDVHKNELEELKSMVEEKMKTALPSLIVPIEVGIGTGNNWLEAH